MEGIKVENKTKNQGSMPLKEGELGRAEQNMVWLQVTENIQINRACPAWFGSVG